MKNGFTLVELSIVLVIIGLLIGGILVGQSLIDSAQVQKAVRGVQSYQIALSQFKSKFRYYPGDIPTDIFSVSPGNGDGHISWRDEGFRAWKMLADFGLIEDAKNASTYTAVQGSSSDRVREGENAPMCDFCDTDEAAVHFSSSPSINPARLQFGVTSAGDSGNRAPGFFPKTAMAIDGKLDDGLPNSGDIIRDGAYATDCNSGNTYKFEFDGLGCALFYDFHADSF